MYKCCANFITLSLSLSFSLSLSLSDVDQKHPHEIFRLQNKPIKIIINDRLKILITTIVIPIHSAMKTRRVWGKSKFNYSRRGEACGRWNWRNFRGKIYPSHPRDSLISTFMSLVSTNSQLPLRSNCLVIQRVYFERLDGGHANIEGICLLRNRWCTRCLVSPLSSPFWMVKINYGSHDRDRAGYELETTRS